MTGDPKTMMAKGKMMMTQGRAMMDTARAMKKSRDPEGVAANATMAAMRANRAGQMQRGGM